MDINYNNQFVESKSPHFDFGATQPNPNSLHKFLKEIVNQVKR